MKVTYEYGWEHTDICIDLPVPYEEDYQMRMLGGNAMSGLLPVRGNGRDGESRYTFRSAGGMSMEKRYESRGMKREEIERFADQLTAAVDDLKRHMLDPDCLLIRPELIFVEDGTFKFCYLPVKRGTAEKSLCVRFHELTEYFVKKVDYNSAEGVFLVCRLHRETMGESYELKKVIEECRKEADDLELPRRHRQEDRRKDRRKAGTAEPDPSDKLTELSESAVFSVDDEVNDEEEHAERPNRLAGRPKKKALRRIRTGRWGDWSDLITENDGQICHGE